MAKGKDKRSSKDKKKPQKSIKEKRKSKKEKSYKNEWVIKGNKNLSVCDSEKLLS